MHVRFLTLIQICTIRDRSLFIALGGGGGWGEGFGGITWFLGEQKGGSVVTENPKGGITENFGKFQGGTTQISLENKDMGGGSRKSSYVIRRDHFSEVTFKGDVDVRCRNIFMYFNLLSMGF